MMHRGWISRLRRIRRATAQVVAVAMLLPALLSLLPQPARRAAGTGSRPRPLQRERLAFHST